VTVGGVKGLLLKIELASPLHLPARFLATTQTREPVPCVFELARVAIAREFALRVVRLRPEATRTATTGLGRSQRGNRFLSLRRDKWNWLSQKKAGLITLNNVGDASMRNIPI
jgi:hypothetical protein